MQIKHYYTQKTKTGCLFDIACTVAQKNRKKIREESSPDFFKYNYLKYESLASILEDNDWLCFFSSHVVKGYPYILGVNLAKNDYRRPLHAVFYDGKQVWEPWKKEFLRIDELKIVYALFLIKKHEAFGAKYERTLKQMKEIDSNILNSKQSITAVDKEQKFKYLEVHEN